jgi:signal transduction histidine kinase
VIVAASLVWSIVRIKKETREGAHIQAHISYIKDIQYRRWNARHGGVYVPVTEETPSNPYLSDIAERDISTPSGKLLTLINPAYMTRQVHEMTEEDYGLKGHITSLNPLRPENAPDAWEAEALLTLGQGKDEISSIQKIGGEYYFRLMHSFTTEKACLKCHSGQGYREGDIRGGISVSIPMEPLMAMERRHILTSGAVHGLLWIVGLVGISFSRRRIQQIEQARKHAEEELRNTADELARSNADLQQFAYAASHDLQEPLRAIAGFVRLLEKRYKGNLDKRAGEYIDYTIHGVKRMQMLIKDLLEYSQIDRQEKPFELTNCSVALEQAIHNLHLSLEESGGELTYDLLPTLMTDASQLSRLFQNLIGNAVKFRGKEPLKIHISAEQKGDEWVFSVRDNGIGMDPRHSERIFVVFQRLHTREEYEGTGIGLSICKKIVERHGGRIWVESEQGKGSTFYFTIPVKG